jgi:hypothetical protein
MVLLLTNEARPWEKIMTLFRNSIILFFTMSFLTFAQQNQPTGLMIDLLSAPDRVELTNSIPSFFWIVDSHQKNETQTAYQILVADSQEKITAQVGNVWDSGKIQSAESINIKYAGAPLASFSTFYWTVRTWDTKGQPGEFAEPQKFQTGDLQKEYATQTLPLVQRRVPPVNIIEKKAGHYFIDFGKAAFGTIELDMPVEKNATVIIHLGEKIKDATTIDRKPGGTIRYRKMKAELVPDEPTVVTIPPDERNTKPRAILMPENIGEVLPFRYCEIEKCPVDLTKENITMLAVNYPFDDDAAFFECSDPVLNDVWELCKYSIKATSFCGVYVDGDRERIPYEADAYINQLCHYGVDREYAMARYSHEYLIKNPTWPTEWILHSVLMAWADYMYTGDVSSLAYFYDDLKHKTLLALARDDGLISTQTGLVTQEVLDAIHLNDTLRDIVDWPPGSFMFGGIGERDNYKMGKINTVVNSFHFEALKLMSRIADVLGKNEDALFFQTRADNVGKTINEKLVDPQTGLYNDCQDSTHSALHSNMWPLAFGLVPDDRKPAVVDFVKSRGMACSVYGAQYLLDGLYEAGEAQYALDLMTARHDRSWPHMIYNVGTTVTLEAWDIKYKKNLDWNHAWGAAPANIIPRHLVGVQPLTPGFEEIQIKPQIADLEFTKAKVPTIRGAVLVSIEQDESSYTLNVTIPGNSSARVYVPYFENSIITIDGEIISGTVDGQFVLFENIGSGEHLFEVQKNN